MADPIIRLNIDASGAVAGLDQLDQASGTAQRTLNDIRKELKSVAQELGGLDASSDEFTKLTQKAGKLKDEIKDISESINANAGPAFENAGNNVARLQGQLSSLDFDGAAQSAKGLAANIKGINFGDLQKGVAGFGSSLATLGKALLANPIFLIGGAIAALIVNFDKIKEALDFGVNPATRDFVEATKEASLASEQALKSFDLEERRLRALGEAEEDIAIQRRRLLIERLKDIQAEALAQSKLLGEQEDNVKKTAEAASQASFNIFKGIEVGIRTLFGATDEEVKAGREALDATIKSAEEIGVQILELDKKVRDGKKDSAKGSAKEVEDIERAAIDNSNIQKIKARDDLAKNIIEIDNSVLQNGLANTQTSLDNFKKDTDEKVAISIAAAKAERDAKIQLASDALGAIAALSEAFAGKSEQSARRAFQINKAASLAQAIISTYQGATAAFASGSANPITIGFPAYPFIQAGIAVVSGLANVAKIAKTKFGDTSGGGAPSAPRPSAGGGGGGSANLPRSGFAQFDLSQINNRPNQPTPAYVLASDVKTQTEAAQKVQDRARL